MTIGISKERLIEKLINLSDCNDVKSYEKREYLKTLILDCTELNPWLPIESAPINKKLRLVHGGQIGRGQTDATLYSESVKQYFTHWQELPADPE